jgi:hypothetical protein
VTHLNNVPTYKKITRILVGFKFCMKSLCMWEAMEMNVACLSSNLNIGLGGKESD